VYVVDLSVRKGQFIGKASGNHYRAMWLPLQECMDVRKPVLNIDNVLIALNEFANHRNWTRAFEVAIRKRMATREGTDREYCIFYRRLSEFPSRIQAKDSTVDTSSLLSS
jgi:hypothetical protein